VVNDVHLLESKGRLAVVHVDTSFNGFLRKLGVRPGAAPRWQVLAHPLRTVLRLAWGKDRFISWRYVQPLSLEDALASDSVSLSITRSQIKELPSEDLADVLEELSGRQQQAVFSALDSQKAAETLMEAEPRAQRQIIARLRQERARTILSQMSVAQLADLLSVLPHDDAQELMGLLPKEQAERVGTILSERESSARVLMSNNCLAMPGETTVGGALRQLRQGKPDPTMISYIYVVGSEKVLQGVVDLRELALAEEGLTLADLMVCPVVTAAEDDLRSDLVEIFNKYHFRMIPVVDAKDRLLGVVRHRDIMKGLETRG
jgi:Mg/Co/Ni transporter MgtE